MPNTHPIIDLLTNYHADLLGTLTRRQTPEDLWRTPRLVAMLNDRFQVLLLQVQERLQGELK
jgi:hypothetical protein